MLLAILIVLGVSVPAFAAVGSEDVITGIISPIDTNMTSYNLETTTPGTDLVFPLTADMFTWKSGKTYGKEPVTERQIRGLTIWYNATKGKREDSIYSIKFADTTFNGKKTRAVKVEFIDDLISTSDLSYGIAVSFIFQKSQIEESRISLIGTIKNKVIDVDSYDDYINLKPHEIILATENVTKLEIYAGNSISVRPRLEKNKKYYLKVRDEFLSEDRAFINKYPSIVAEISLTTINLNRAEVFIDNYPECYVYDEKGAYLGMTETWLPLSKKYFVSEKQLNISGGTSTSSKPASSSQASKPASSKPASSSQSTGSASKTLTVSEATKITKAAYDAAKSKGQKNAVVTVKDIKSISPDAFAAVVKASALPVTFRADTMSGKTIAGRITVYPTSKTTLKGDLGLGVFTDEANTKTTKAFFSKWYKNNIAVISLGNKADFGMSVTIAAKVNINSFKSKDIRVYAYDKSKNSFKEVKNSGVNVDKNGYVNFKTTFGGDIIISDGPLVRK